MSTHELRSGNARVGRSRCARIGCGPARSLSGDAAGACRPVARPRDTFRTGTLRWLGRIRLRRGLRKAFHDFFYDNDDLQLPAVPP